MDTTPITFLVVLFLVLWAEFVNGWTDAPNAIATVVTTKVLSPKKAVILATVFNIIGAFAGTAVATTIGKGIVRTEIINLQTLASAMLSIIIWSTFAWKYGLPTSESHALVSGLTGAGLASGGFEAILWQGWGKVLVGLVFSTFLGFGSSYLLFLAIAKFFPKGNISKMRRIFGRLQLFSAGFMAFSHGSNDGQKFIGIFALALVLGGVTQEFIIPIWVIFIVALTMGVGTMIGGWRIIKTIGIRLTKLETPHGFAAETAAATVIELASRLGIPLSTTHTIGTAIIGVGAVQKVTKVRWEVASSIVGAWILTFPVCGLIAWTITKLSLYFI